MKQANEGFTLIEVLVILTIVGIVAALAIPSILGYVQKQKEKDAIVECRSVVAAATSYYTDQYTKNSDTQSSINASDIIEFAGVDGKIVGTVRFDENSLKVIQLNYQSSNDIYVLYNREANQGEKYRIVEAAVADEDVE